MQDADERFMREAISLAAQAAALGGLFDLNALPHNHRLAVRAGVLESACAARLTRFFQGLRAPEG